MKSIKPSARRVWLWLAIAMAIILTLAIAILSTRDSAVAYYLDLTGARLRSFINPLGAPPTPQPTPQSTSEPSRTPQAVATQLMTGTALPTDLPQPTPTQLPERVELPAPLFEGQDWNNCGPATLALQLRMFGWEGDQFTISDEIKPMRNDRNVNIDELLYYVSTRAGWLNALYRVGGDLDMLKRFIAAGLPVVIEESFTLPVGAEGLTGPSDDRWTGHYLLLTGYDDSAQAFITQDTFRGADQYAPYADVDRNWQAFNRVYLLVYRPEQADLVQSILADDSDPTANREQALAAAESEAEQDPSNAYAWFNVGSNLVYFESYIQAALAFDTARQLGLPQRMLRYQFGPFLAYFHTSRNEDLLALTEYALQVTPNSEEALLWRGWALYRDGDRSGAAEHFQKALEAHPGYEDAIYGLNFLREN